MINENRSPGHSPLLRSHCNLLVCSTVNITMSFRLANWMKITIRCFAHSGHSSMITKTDITINHYSDYSLKYIFDLKDNRSTSFFLVAVLKKPPVR